MADNADRHADLVRLQNLADDWRHHAEAMERDVTIELIHQLREALGFDQVAMAKSPKQVWEETLEYVRMMAGTGKYDDRGVCS